MDLDEKVLEGILKGDDLAKVENEIARRINSYVDRNHFDLAVGFVKRDVTNSALGLDTIMGVVMNEHDKLIAFGVEFLSDEDATNSEEEYPDGEEPEENEKSIAVRSGGLLIGFGIKYAIYYNFLETSKLDSLTSYLKASRIPFAAKFSRQLQGIFKRLRR